ncbi:thioredoxin family protein [Deinococcus sp. Arct2-2]|uniref:thioredoxin family protein n=1 Tax=Deinococcus sp. Arct2-2 TaxID=2568653 RepID=UPI0010A4160D|nr:thioredoxin family protein [Deinococcus sp. Arct2-2]THF68358.1 thioredoxin family protein [Deinococcus sp. Arct2-2]
MSNTAVSRSALSRLALPALVLPGLLVAAALLSSAAPAQTMTTPAKSEPAMTDTMKKSGGYVAYTKAAFDAAKGTQRVLFFHATWCPNCKAADADITKNLAQLPAGVTIFKTDYDKESALKKQYGITYQHTFVLVDAQGKALKKWAGGTLRDIIAKTKTAS